jgi:hypothetical protein
VLRRRKPVGFFFAPGMYVYLSYPKISRYEWHPFTLTSAPQDSFISVHIKEVGRVHCTPLRLVASSPPHPASPARSSAVSTLPSPSQPPHPHTTHTLVGSSAVAPAVCRHRPLLKRAGTATQPQPQPKHLTPTCCRQAGDWTHALHERFRGLVAEYGCSRLGDPCGEDGCLGCFGGHLAAVHLPRMAAEENLGPTLSGASSPSFTKPVTPETLNEAFAVLKARQPSMPLAEAPPRAEPLAVIKEQLSLRPAEAADGMPSVKAAVVGSCCCTSSLDSEHCVWTACARASGMPPTAFRAA